MHMHIHINSQTPPQCSVDAHRKFSRKRCTLFSVLSFDFHSFIFPFAKLGHACSNCTWVRVCLGFIVVHCCLLLGGASAVLCCCWLDDFYFSTGFRNAKPFQNKWLTNFMCFHKNGIFALISGICYSSMNEHLVFSVIKHFSTKQHLDLYLNVHLRIFNFWLFWFKGECMSSVRDIKFRLIWVGNASGRINGMTQFDSFWFTAGHFGIV